MSRRFNLDASVFRRHFRIRSSGAQLHLAVVVTVALSLLYCTSARHDDAIAAPEGRNPPISVKLRPPQLHPILSRASGDQPYPGLQIVARQKLSRVTGPVIRPRIANPGEQRIGRSRAVFTTPPLTIQQPAPRIPTPVRQPSSGIVTGGVDSPADPVRKQTPGGQSSWARKIPPQAKYEQRQWELKRSVNVFRATVEKSLTDVEIANREVATAYSEMQSRFQAMSAAENETAYLRDRFDVLPMVEDSATLLLEDLLDSFERLADEEAGFVQALVDHAVALVKLKKELGILLRSRNASPTVESSEQQWMSNRLDAAVDGRSADAGSKDFPDKTDDLPVEAYVPRTLTPKKSANIGRSEEADVPETRNTSQIPATKSNGAQEPSPTKPRRVGGHTF